MTILSNFFFIATRLATHSKCDGAIVETQIIDRMMFDWFWIWIFYV